MSFVAERISEEIGTMVAIEVMKTLRELRLVKYSTVLEVKSRIESPATRGSEHEACKVRLALV